MGDLEEFEIKNIDSSSIELYKNCFNDNGSNKSKIKLEWQLLKIPFEGRYVNIAVHKESNKTAGTYAVFPIPFKVGERKVIGSQAIDAITDKNFRGNNLFIKLAKNVYNTASEGGVKLVFGIPNGISVHGHKNKLGWNLLDPLPFMMKPINSRYFTDKIKILKWFPNIRIFGKKRLKNSARLVVDNSFNQSVDEIWQMFSKNIQVGVIRNLQYLNWRYIEKPLEDYRIVHAYGNQDNEYLGYIIYCVKEKHGGKIGYIMEYVFNPERESEVLDLLVHANNEIVSSGADCILSWCFDHSPNYKNYKKLNFFNLHEKLRPIELHFGTRVFDDSLASLVYKRENWYLSYSDSDTV